MDNTVSDEQQLREQICLIGQMMYANGYIRGASGNISARLDAKHILVTPSGVTKNMLSPGQLIAVDINGMPVDPVTPETKHLRPTPELPMHLECYKQRSDIGGVVHAHPPIATALTIAGYNFQQCLIPEMIVILGLVPTAPYSTPSSTENRDTISELIFDHDAIMLAHQGSLTVAHTVWEAYLHLEILEHCANILQYVEQLGGHKQAIPWHQVEKLLDLREQKGLLRPGDTIKFRRICREATGDD